MISDRSDFRAQIQRLSVIMIRMCYRWISNHPFLLGFVGFLYFLHRTCPLLFSPLVTASPVLICTFVLLGTILSFGEPNIPEIEKELEIEKEPEIVQEAAHFRTEVSRNATVVERVDKSFTVERSVSMENGVIQDGNDDADRLEENQLSEVEDDVQSFDYRPLVDETLDEVQRYTQVRFEEKELALDLEKRQGRLKEKFIENGGMQVSGAEQSRKNGGEDDSKEDQMDVSPISPWRPMRHEDDEDDDADRDDSMDSDSDGAESSSPDASMTDIIPMLDELHPLLHSEDLSRGIADGDGSDASSEGSDRSSSDEGMASDVDSESHGEEGDNENEEEDEGEEEEEEKKEDKQDESKSAIKWTEVDQKNVMDLGSLELERNQRLENLIARRRARHNMRLMAERNLIDFDSADIPFNMPPISTARNNPFDLPYDSYDDMPIPGSAPSIMLARRNPFDLPYEPNEEKPDLKGDGVREESSSQQPKDPVFRRHESFSVGASMLGGPRHDRLRPFFVLEKLATEGTSYYPFERQLSEISESKVSSVPDTESVCTIMEEDEKKVDEHDADHETEIAKVDMSSDHDEVKSHSSSDHDEVKSHSGSDHDEDKSHSSEDSDFHGQDDNRNIHHDVAEIILGSGEQSNMMEGETSDKEKDDEEGSSDSDSSLSENEDKVSDFSEDESLLISERKVDIHEESGTSSHYSSGDLEVHVARGVEDDYHHDETHTEDSMTANPSLDEATIDDLRGLVDSHHEEPVFDSSPSASRFPSFSSVSSDYKPDLTEKNVEEVREYADKDSEVYSETLDPAETYSTYDETETRTREVGETSTHVIEKASLSESEFEDALHVPSSQEDLKELHEDVKETVDTRAINDSASSVDLVSPTEEEDLSTGMVEQHHPIVTTLESPNVVHDIPETSVNRSVAEGIMNEETEAQKDVESPQTSNANIPIDSYSTLSSGAVEYVEMHSFNEETNPSDTMDIEVDSVNASAPNVGSGETTSSELHRELTWSDKSVVEQSSLEPGEDQLPTRAGVVFSRNITFHEYHDAPEDTAELSSLTSDSSSSPAESPEYKTPMVGEGSRAEFFQEAVYDELDDVVERLEQLTDLHEISQSPDVIITEEADEIKEIDEGLLSELDTIGDFNVKEVVTDSEPGPSSIGLDTANELTEDMPVLEVRSLEDMESAFQQIHEGSEVEDVILPSTVQDQLAQENIGTSTETISDLSVVEATSKQDLDNAMNQAVAESMSTQTKTPESDETEPVDSLVDERSLDVTNTPMNNTSEREEEQVEESRPREITLSDVSPVETQSPEELQEPSESKMTMEIDSQTDITPKDAIGSSDEIVIEEANTETANNIDANVHTPEIKEIPKNLGETIVSSSVTLSDEFVTTDVNAETVSNSDANVQTLEPKETPEKSGESTGSSTVTLSDEVVTADANTESANNTDATAQTPEPKETPDNAGESIESSTVTLSGEVVTADANAETEDNTDAQTPELKETPEKSGEVIGSSSVTLSDESMTTDANAETVNNTVENVQTPELKETPEKSGEGIGSSTVTLSADVNAETVNNTDSNVQTPEVQETPESSRESIGSSNARSSDEIETTDTNTETVNNTDVNVQTHELKETPENPGEIIAEHK